MKRRDMMEMITRNAEAEKLDAVSERLADMERRGDLDAIEEIICKPLEGVILSNASEEARSAAYLRYRAIKAIMAVMRSLAEKHLEGGTDE